MKQLKKEDSIAYKMRGIDKGVADLPDIMMFENQKPYWSSKKHGYVLQFSDKIKCSSVKNFQLVKRTTEATDPDSPKEVFFEFGKISSNEFSLSFKHPFSITNAFAIALTAFDK